MHDEFGSSRGDEAVVAAVREESVVEPEAALVDERYEYRLMLVERCRDDLQRVLVPGEVGVILDPENDSFAEGLCVMLGASGLTMTFASIPAESLLAGLASTNAELGRALGKAPPSGHSWVVVVGRGSAGMALVPTVSSCLN
jgi:hypothetical protein